MKWRPLAGVIAVIAVTLAVIGIVSNFFLGNDLLFSSQMQVAALVSLGFVLGSLVVFGVLGRPWNAWERTPYW